MIPFIFQLIETPEQYDCVQQIYTQYYSRMVACAKDVLKNHDDAEDAAMMVLTEVSENPDWVCGLDNTALVATISSMSKRRAIDIYRKKHQINKNVIEIDDADCNFMESIPDPDEDLEEIAITRETRRLVVKAIKSLDEIYQTPILMKYYYRKSNKEIARELGLTESTVNQRILRAKRKIKK